MPQSDFIPLSGSELTSFRSTVKAYYELEDIPVIPELPAGTNMNQNVEIITTELNKSFGASVGISGVVNISGDAEYEYHAMDIMKRVIVTGDPAGPILSATYGIGARIILKIKKINSEIDIKLPKLAAQTQLGQVETSIALQLRGFGAGQLPNVEDDIFTFSEFNLDKYTKVNTLINTIENYLTSPDNEQSYDPVLVGVELKRIYADDIADIFEWGNYALWRIAQKNSLSEAFKMAEEKGVQLNATEKDVVRRTYALIFQRPAFSIVGSENQAIGQAAPNNTERTKAKQLLIKYRVFTEQDV